MGLFDEAAGFAQRAVELAPDDGAHWLELEEILAWSGRHQEMDTAWAEVTRLLDGPALVAAWARRGRQFRSVVCHPRASEQAYRRAAELLTDDVPAAVHADVLVGLAWGDAVAGDARAYEQLLSRAEALLSGQIGPRIASDIAEIRLQGLIRQGRFAAAAEVAIPAGLAADAARLVDRSYAVWVHAACAMTCAGDDEKALEFAEHAVAATRGLPALHVGCVATRAQLLARLGRHTEAAEAASEELAIAERLDSPEPLATAAHDAGLVAFAAGRYADAAELLETALGGPAAVSRPTAGLLRAEALARADRPQEAKRALRRATTEPVGRADQPWALVPRVAWVQGLIASAQGDLVLAERRYDEAAEGWTRMLATVATETAQGYLAMLVDLGRPPVVGLTEPKRELARIDDARAQLRQSIGVR
jgi:tetratricopeptide (TPR) repeat protein